MVLISVDQAFLVSHIALSGIPLLLFTFTTLGIFFFTFLAALTTAIIGALLFTAFAVGIALLFLLPTLFITTFAATIIFLWILAEYYLLKFSAESNNSGLSIKLKDGTTQRKVQLGVASPID